MTPKLLATAADRWGTPLYLVDLDAVAANLAAYRRHFPEALIAYALKANADPQLLRRLVGEGAGCEVVNAVELELALRAGCPADRLVMDGVGKTDDDLRAGLAAGCLLNVESLDELEAVIALRPPRGARIGLRINPAVDPATHPHLATGAADSKFGIGLADLPRAFDLMRSARLPLAALGAHIGSDVSSAAPFGELGRRLAESIALAARVDLRPDVVDVGGGLPDPGTERLAALGAALAPLAGHRLILEPGRSLVADAGVLLTRVVRVQAREGRMHLVADAGMSDLLRPMLYGAEHPVQLVTAGEALTVDGRVVSLSGPVCEAGDILVADLRTSLSGKELDRAGRGALLAILFAGAYGAVMASNYNGRLRPAQAVLESGELRLSMRRETVADLVARQI